MLSRRMILAGGLILPIAPPLALAATPRNLSFAVFRNNGHIGEHHIAFTAGDGGAVTATTDALMTVKIGPVPVFKYHHHAVETRRDGQFATLETATTTNGKAERVEAERTDGVVRVDCATGKATLASNVNPLTHWNPKIFEAPLFHPQTGKMLKIRTVRDGANRWLLHGEVEMENTYDESGAWLAAKAKADDGSTIEYRRI